MAKPFDEAVKLKDICRFCIQDKEHYFKVEADSKTEKRMAFCCSRFYLGAFDEFCTKENYRTCTFNEVNLRSTPPRKTVPPPGPPENAHRFTTGKDKAPAAGPPLSTKEPGFVSKNGKPGFTPAQWAELEGLVFKDVGELKRAALNKLNYQPSQVDHIAKGYDLTFADDRVTVWADILQTYKKWLKEER